MEAVERHGHGIREQEVLDPPARAREMLLMGLRLARGIDPERFAARTGMALANALEPPPLADAIAAGWLARSPGGALAATAAGRLRLDALLPALLRRGRRAVRG